MYRTVNLRQVVPCVPPCERRVSSWFAYVAAGLVCAQLLGLNVAPLLAVGGASSIIVGLATQQLLTNTVMGLSLVRFESFWRGLLLHTCSAALCHLPVSCAPCEGLRRTCYTIRQITACLVRCFSPTDFYSWLAVLDTPVCCWRQCDGPRGWCNTHWHSGAGHAHAHNAAH